MKRASIVLAMLIMIPTALTLFSSCQKKSQDEAVYVSVPFEDKGFKESTLLADTESLNNLFLSFPSQEQKLLPKSGFTSKGLIQNFNTVYPTLAEAWSHGKLKDVVYTVNTVSDGVADTRGTGKTNESLITMYLNYYKSQSSSELDSITHELTHVCQENYDTGYGGEDTDDNGSWIVEGMTDYSRYTYGMYPGGFALPAYDKSHSYTQSYRVTARFFVWVEENICPTFAEQMNEALRTERYSSEFFTRITGYSLKELWAMYDADGGRIINPATGQKTSASVTR